MRTILLLFTFYTVVLQSQVNCYQFSENSSMRKACELSHKAIKHKQGSRKSQELFDESIKTDSNFAYSYREKSIPFFKRGFLLEGMELLDKAVVLEPKNNLSYRAYWNFQYLNYKLCIRDLEQFYALPNPYIKELTTGGDNDMRILLGMSYAKLGEYKKAIKVTKECIADYEKGHFKSNYLRLGMFYYLNGNIEKAVESLKIQLEINNKFPDTHYYLGLINQQKNEIKKSERHFKKAKELFSNKSKSVIFYSCYRVTKADIELELKKITK